MCGIVGIISSSVGKDQYTKKRYMDQAIVIDTIRGKDSAGVFATEHNGHTRYAKVVGTGFDLVKHEYWRNVFQDGADKYKFIVGHNRAATRGGVSLDTAHPYTEGPITLVHNGTLVTTYNLKMSQTESKSFNDSHTICKNLALTDNPLEVLEKLDGAFALVWHDARDDSLNMARNKERPLHLAKSQDTDTIYFASEGELLYYLNERNKMNLGPIVSLKVGNYLKFSAGKLMKPHIKEFKIYEYKPGTYHSGYWKNTHGSLPLAAVIGEPSVNDLGKKTDTQTLKVGQPIPTITESKIDIGGRKISVPQLCQEDLLEYDLTCDELECFIPCRGEKVSNYGEPSIYTVWGYLEKEDRRRGINAEIHGVSGELWERCADRVWSIRPIGVKWQDRTTPAIVGRFSSVVTPVGTIRYIKSREPDVFVGPTNKPPARFVYEDDDAEGIEDVEVYPGPHGIFLPRGEWFKATNNGCISCGIPIPLSEAEFIEWVNDGRDPLCSKCVDMYTDCDVDCPFTLDGEDEYDDNDMPPRSKIN